MDYKATRSRGGDRESSRSAATVFAHTYILGRKIAAGSFGTLYHAKHAQNGGNVAVKLEDANTRHPQLQAEARWYRMLAGGVGFPSVHWYGTEHGSNALVMDLLGSSIGDLHEKHSRRLSVKTVLMLADQLIQRYEFLHSRGILHRDVKPDNMVMGTGKNADMAFLVDFGLAKRYVEASGANKGRHIPYSDGYRLTGTARYASITTHKGVHQTRRDDMEALGHVLLFLLRGRLPWQDQPGGTKQKKYDNIMAVKIKTPISSLCQGFPQEFADYLTYCRSLRFDEAPDYRYLRRLFRQCMEREGYENDLKFDWTDVARSATGSRSRNRTAEGGTTRESRDARAGTTPSKVLPAAASRSLNRVEGREAGRNSRQSWRTGDRAPVARAAATTSATRPPYGTDNFKDPAASRPRTLNYHDYGDGRRRAAPVEKSKRRSAVDNSKYHFPKGTTTATGTQSKSRSTRQVREPTRTSRQVGTKWT